MQQQDVVEYDLMDEQYDNVDNLPDDKMTSVS